jgi:hypothetical protein
MSSYPRRQNSSWLQEFTDVNTAQLQKVACYKATDNSVLDATGSEWLSSDNRKLLGVMKDGEFFCKLEQLSASQARL